MVISRFAVPEDEAGEFRVALERAHAVLARQRGYLTGTVGRNVDDPTMWALVTHWEGPGVYRRALSAYDVKLEAWALLGRALDEPSAYEPLEPGQPSNDVQPRGTD